MSIDYGPNVQLPDVIYERAISFCRIDPDGHWIWYGSTNAKTKHPQIGATSLVNGVKKVKVVSVLKLIYVVKRRLCGNKFPYQVRRNKSLCQNSLCVNPDHAYHIQHKAERVEKVGSKS